MLHKEDIPGLYGHVILLEYSNIKQCEVPSV
jgi:hypothetical protein